MRSGMTKRYESVNDSDEEEWPLMGPVGGIG